MKKYVYTDFNGTLTELASDMYTMLIESGIPLEQQKLVASTPAFKLRLARSKQAAWLDGWARECRDAQRAFRQQIYHVTMVTGCVYEDIVRRWCADNIIPCNAYEHVPFNGEADYVEAKANRIMGLIEGHRAIHPDAEHSVFEDSGAVLARLNEWPDKGNVQLWHVQRDGSCVPYQGGGSP